MHNPDLNRSKNIILVPTDFSEVCANAIMYAAQLAQFLDNKLVILHVIDDKTKASMKKKKTGIEYVKDRLNHYKATHEKKYGISVETLMIEGTIFTSINKAASDLEAAMMVVGTHGKSGMQYFTEIGRAHV